MIPAAIALSVGVWGVLTQRAMARRRATMDHVAAANMDRDMIKASKRLIELAHEDGGLAKWAELDKESSDEVDAIRRVLNDFEMVSASIQFGIMDYDLYYKYNHGTVKRYWLKSAPFVHALRDRLNSTTVYSEFEQLYLWVSGTKRPRATIWLKKMF